MRPVTASALVAVVIAAACGASDRPSADPASALRNVEWVLVELDGGAVITRATPGTPQGRVTLRFLDGGALGASGGCNQLSGTYTATSPGLRASITSTTRMTCVDPELSRQEGAFITALQSVDHYRLSGDTLSLHADTTRRLRFIATR